MNQLSQMETIKPLAEAFGLNNSVIPVVSHSSDETGKPEKLHRLRLALDDVPQELFDKLTPAETATLEIALKSLKEKLDSPQRKELAKKMWLCANNEMRAIAHSNLDANQLKERLGEELLDRLRPDLTFIIKMVSVFQEARSWRWSKARPRSFS
ncbi:hypothetical protein GPALN_012158 [Globodera pallida]|nr:hypothetical protein GPALN_012158 [Globodera pallida]